MCIRDRQTGFDLESMCDQQGRLQQSKLRRLRPDIQSRLDRLYADPARPGKTFEAKYPNSDMCCKLLADMAPASPCVQELNVLRDIQSADKARKRKNCPDKRKVRGNFCFQRQLHLQAAVTYVYVSSLACKFAFLSCRLSHCSGRMLSLIHIL